MGQFISVFAQVSNCVFHENRSYQPFEFEKQYFGYDRNVNNYTLPWLRRNGQSCSRAARGLQGALCVVSTVRA
jgi:hypothetical protein